MKIFIFSFVFMWVSLFKYGCSQESLPLGSHPSSLEFDHFPNKIFAFIWRNWNLVDIKKMAEVIECHPRDVLEVGYSMGLSEPLNPSRKYQKQLYITIIRRNWHLLPYSQLMKLLEMSAEELAFSLREDDFLFIKLGNLKPKCNPLIYEIPSESEWEKAAWIKGVVENHFNGDDTDKEPRLSFIKDLSKYQSRVARNNEEGLRFIYSYFGVFGDPLMDPDLDPYPDGLLAQLAEFGVNGVWMHVVLNQLSHQSSVFPEFGEDSSIRLKRLQTIVDRAAKYGIKIYLYINEPRSMPVSFFDNHSELGGVVKNGYQTLCTSIPTVQDWMKKALEHVFSQVHGLGGVFTITASENLTSCASHGHWKECENCKNREYPDIIAEVNHIIEEGVHKGNPEAKVIVWDWGWNGHGDGTEIIRKLPDDVWFMSVSEWAQPFHRGGVDSKVGEYSISVVGPGPRARKHWEVANEMGLNTAAKVQFNNTWELSSVPWIPVMDLIAEHAENLTQSGVDGYMLSWSLGGYPSPNLRIAQQFNQDPGLSKEKVLNEMARERYGKEFSAFVRNAWTAFSKAFSEFPYGGGVVYKAPQQYGPANLLYENPTNYGATMVGFPYDDLDGWRGSYSPESFTNQFRKLSEKWKEGLGEFEKIFTEVDPDRKEIVLKDYGIAKAVYLHYTSVANQCEFIMKRGIESEKGRLLEIVKEEIQLAKELYEITCHDSRIGFEATNQYYYLPEDLMEKVISCNYILDSLKK
ncbi:hypothetical protein [Membranihabitans maritimus]|uniref:hypothetical protein n=1 Tax=Membranihabitans maritimus TaxID=2904244 RepID=UPI001F34053D|nr:hypothetical protein [Membranihabitans maritimus]